jgi:hypothetical protein
MLRVAGRIFLPPVRFSAGVARSITGVTNQTVRQLFADDVPVNGKELAQAMRVSRWTVYRWKEKGYRFEFGNRTTAGHLKAWLRDRTAEEPVADKERERLALALSRLR